MHGCQLVAAADPQNSQLSTDGNVLLDTVEIATTPKAALLNASKLSTRADNHCTACMFSEQYIQQ
jgi:hypothetical protein